LNQVRAVRASASQRSHHHLLSAGRRSIRDLFITKNQMAAAVEPTSPSPWRQDSESKRQRD
jgi:hypothetical protein